MNSFDNTIVQIIENIKKDIISTRNKTLSIINQELIQMYFRIGKVISENARYGNDFINSLSKSLKVEFPGVSGYSPRNLARMRKFYKTYKDLSILPPAVAKLPWTHNSILIDKVNDANKRIWYAEKCFDNSWSKIVLTHQIDIQLYERQAINDNKFTNFDSRLPEVQGELASDMLKDPYIFELIVYKEKKN